MRDLNPPPIQLDPATGQMRPIHRGTRAERSHRVFLRKLIGEYGELAYEGILAIAQGKLTYSKLVRKPQPHETAHDVAMIPRVEVQPTIRERFDAWVFLAEQLNGRAASTLDLSVDQATLDIPTARYDRLRDDELKSLEDYLRRIQAEALPSGG